MVNLEGNLVPLLENRKPDLWRKLPELQTEPQACSVCCSSVLPNTIHHPWFHLQKNHTQLCALVFSKGFQKQQSDLRAWK